MRLRDFERRIDETMSDVEKNLEAYRDERDRAARFNDHIVWCDVCGHTAPMHEWDKEFIPAVGPNPEYLRLTCSSCGWVLHTNTLRQECEHISKTAPTQS